jgi:L-rhamnose mutarotase
MTRNAFVMKLKPGCEAEYQKRHDEIWPELEAELRRAGVSDYSIYLDRPTLLLFAFQRLADGHTSDDLPNSPVVKRWWASMAPLMETHADSSPVTRPLDEVFHLD